jgi:hypothetical protein
MKKTFSLLVAAIITGGLSMALPGRASALQPTSGPTISGSFVTMSHSKGQCPGWGKACKGHHSSKSSK